MATGWDQQLSPPQVHVEIHNGDFLAKIIHVMPGELGECAILWWTDGVANEWRETHDTLSIALLRLAMLQRGYEMGVAGDQGWFRQADAQEFLGVTEGIFEQCMVSESESTRESAK